MYNEQADFAHHRHEVTEALALAEKLGVSSSGFALDLGGGQGMHIGFLNPVFERVFCADILQYSSLYEGRFLQLLDEKYRRNGFSINLAKSVFVQTDGMSLLFRDNFFDWCFAFNSFEHIPDPGQALREVVRVLKPGGCAYVSFDPVWTADTGSHFFHRVPEPWAHLVYSRQQYHEKMTASGASSAELSEFDSAMNRWRPEQYLQSLKEIGDSGVEILFQDKYEGVADASHKSHKFFKKAKGLGFSEDELILRRLRWVIRKNG